MKHLPNILTFLRLILAPVFLYMYVQDELVWRSLSLVVFAVAAVTDFFDGYIARAYDVESKSGVFMDPLADKFLTFAGFVCLPVLDPVLFPWWAVGVIVARDLIVTILRIVADVRKISVETRYLAKVKTLVQMIFLYICLLIGVFMQADIPLSEHVLNLMDTSILYWSMMGVTGITAYTGIEYLVVNRHLFSGSARS
ncbi:MAG: CDP-alcohol phosphatidyltransferase family protein [Bacteroidota bacterium]